MPHSSVSSFSKSVQFQFTGIAVLTLLAFSTFYLAWGQMRYSDTTVIPMEYFVYWRFAMAGWLPLVGFLVTCLFVAKVVYSMSSPKVRSLKMLSLLHQIVCALALVWCLIFCAWEITAWTECNDPGPKHPECRNREYPAKTIADYSFIMMVIAAAVMAGAMAWALYFNSMVAINRSALQISGGVDLVASRYEEHRSTKGMHFQHSKSRRHHTTPTKMNFMDSQGEN